MSVNLIAARFVVLNSAAFLGCLTPSLLKINKGGFLLSMYAGFASLRRRWFAKIISCHGGQAILVRFFRS